MITDKIENIDKYKEIPIDIQHFIKNLSRDIELGRIALNDNNYANVETYQTKKHEDCLFEAHEKFADIQIILEGKERLDYVSSEGLTIKTPYNPEKDIVFYENNKPETASVILDGSNFVMLFPNEPHRPQMAASNGSQTVKKIVVKLNTK